MKGNKIINMNALIDLNKCREYMTINIGKKDHNVKLSGTIKDPHFCGKEVCHILGHKNTNDAISRHVKPKNKKTLKELLMGVGKLDPHFLGTKNPQTHNELMTVYINEPGLYSLIMHSNVPFAEEFQDIVYETILPSIRKYGSYQVETQLTRAMEQLAIKEKSHEEETKELEERLKQEKEARLKAENEAKEQREYSLILKELAINDQKRPLNEAIYISTSKGYSMHNRYKVGGVEGMDKLKSRFAGYNGRSSVDDLWYYSDIFRVANFRAAEKRIEDVLGRFRERKNKEI